MGKYLKSLTDGSLRCKYCGAPSCDCMEDGRTILGLVAVWHYPNKSNNGINTFVQLRKQTLPNGRRVPSGIRLYIPATAMPVIDEVLKTIALNNDFLNKLRFE